MKPLLKKFSWVTLFSIAMGFMETAVVVYLRKIYYPNGFQFPLVPMDADLVVVEIMREAATIIMLIGIGILTGKSTSQKFAYFIYSFAIWDIFYYIFLKVLLDWPESLFTMDILFLIPVPWVGPVIAPIIVSLSMIALTAGIIYYSEAGQNTTLRKSEWWTLILGSLVVIISFAWDFVKYLFTANDNGSVYAQSGNNMQIMSYIPGDFNWVLYLAGQAIILTGIIIYLRRLKINSSKLNPSFI